MSARRRLQLLTAVLCAVPSVALAHSARGIEPHDLWRSWTFEPLALTLILLTAFLFCRGLVRQHDSLGRWPERTKSRTAVFALGWMILTLSLVSPLHALGGALFSAHMVQHELLMTVAAPLLVLSRPYPVFLWGLPQQWRAHAGRMMYKGVARKLRFAASPLAAWSLHAMAIWIWHIPALYGATLTSEWVHIAQHVSFIGTSLLFWWSVLPAGHGRDSGASLFYLFATAVHTAALGALLTFSSTSWYAAYADSSVRWGLAPLEDQQLGGLIMWIPGGLSYLIACLWIGWRMLALSETRAVRAAVALLLICFAGSCKSRHEANEKIFTRADARHGKDLIRKYGCQVCHVIPGIRGANGMVGPSLSGIASRAYIGGVAPNAPGAMVLWIQHPQLVDPRTAMPDVGVTPPDARDIAAYLYTLR